MECGDTSPLWISFGDVREDMSATDSGGICDRDLLENESGDVSPHSIALEKLE